MPLSAKMKQRIRTGTFAFHDEYWKDVSEPAKEVRAPLAHACLLACLPACLLACLPACLLACLPACLPLTSFCLQLVRGLLEVNALKRINAQQLRQDPWIVGNNVKVGGSTCCEQPLRRGSVNSCCGTK